MRGIWFELVADTRDDGIVTEAAIIQRFDNFLEALNEARRLLLLPRVVEARVDTVYQFADGTTERITSQVMRYGYG